MLLYKQQCCGFYISDVSKLLEQCYPTLEVEKVKDESEWVSLLWQLQLCRTLELGTHQACTDPVHSESAPFENSHVVRLNLGVGLQRVTGCTIFSTIQKFCLHYWAYG